MGDVALTTLVCELLGGIDGWAWRPSGPAYTLTEVGVHYGAIKPSPDLAVGVRIYSWTDERFLAWRRLQLRIRGAKGDPAGADRLAQSAFDALHEISRTGGISSIVRQSATPLGADDNGREERTENYLIILDNPEAVL